MTRTLGNLTTALPEKVIEMKTLLERLITDGCSTSVMQQTNDVEVARYPRTAAPKNKAEAAK